jgi:hypothetical protein
MVRQQERFFVSHSRSTTTILRGRRKRKDLRRRET